MNEAIDISNQIPVTSEVNNVLDTRRLFLGIGFTVNPLVPTSTPILEFTSADTVGTYFGKSSNEYKRAVKYFAASTISTLLPPTIYFGKWFTEALAPFLLSSTIFNPATTLVTLKAITAGTFVISINGVVYTTSTIDLSTATSLSNAATLLATKMKTDNVGIPASFTITYDGVNNKFTASITETGATKTLSYATIGNIATAMNLTQAAGAVLSQGTDVMTTTQNLDYLAENFKDQFSLLFVDDLNGNLTDVINLEVAQWVNDKNLTTEAFAFFCWSAEPAILQENDTTSINYLITQSNLNSTAVFTGQVDGVTTITVDDVINSAFAASGIFAAVDLSQPNSAMTLAWKSQDSLNPTITNSAVAKILNSKGVNYYGHWKLSGGTQSFNFFMPGAISGKWKFIDNLMGQVYLAAQIQGDLANLFISNPQIPSDPDGQSLIKSTIGFSCQQCLTSQLIVKGLSFSVTTAQSILNIYGISVNELTQNGYAIVNTLPTETLRALRIFSPWYVLYVKGSAVNVCPIQTKTYY